VQNSFLARVISLFEDISTYQSSRGQELRKRKKARRLQSSRERKKRKLEATFEDESPAAQTEASREPASPVAVDLGSPTTQAPAIMKHLTIGINQVTKKLESQVKAYRTTRVIAPDMQLEAAGSGCHVVVVLGCRADVDPPLLIAHLPHLVAAYNSSILSRPSSADSPLIKLVPLPKGAELLLAEALGLRRVAVVAFDVCLLTTCLNLSFNKKSRATPLNWLPSVLC
jgi:ribonuclease P/MRP protein subunit POP3